MSLKGFLKRHTFTRRSVIKGTAAGAALAGSAAVSGCAKKPAAKKLAIVHTNDTHGHDLLNEESLGMAAAVQLRTDYEAQGYEVLLLDAGDAIQGENLVNRSMGKNGIDFMNRCAYDAMCLGNHEFDFGQDVIQQLMGEASFPVLSSNTIVDATGETFATPHVVLTTPGGTKVGVFGLTTPSTVTTCSPLIVQGITFLSGEELWACAQKEIDALKAEGCDLIVCLGHLGEEDENNSSRAMDVVANTRGLNLFIDGHDHQEENALMKDADGRDVLVVETGCYTHNVGVVTWEDGALAGELKSFGSYEGQDAEVAAYIQGVSDQVHAELDQLVATTDFFLDGERSPGVRTGETNLGDIIADSLLWEAQLMADETPDCALVNGGAIRGSLQAGDITLYDMLNVYPFINYVCTVQVTGAQLLEAIEAGCATLPEPLGAFPQVANMHYTIDTRVPFEDAGTYPHSTFLKPARPGARVTIQDVGGREFDPEDTYIIASTDFICTGGDAYYVFAEAAQASVKSINYLTTDTLQYYLQEGCGGVVGEQYADPAGEGRITVLS